MNLYLISQTVNDDWNTFDAAVVAAETEDEARSIHPGSLPGPGGLHRGRFYSWAAPEDITVRLIGTAAPGTAAGVVLASFNPD